MFRGIRKFSLKNHLPSLFFLGGVILLVIIAMSFTKDFLRARKVNQEIMQLQNELSLLENKNIELNNLIQYFDSEIYAVKKARTELGLKKPGESVIVIPKNENEENLAVNLSEIKKNESHINKWWKYFFEKK